MTFDFTYRNFFGVAMIMVASAAPSLLNAVEDMQNADLAEIDRQLNKKRC